MYSCGPSEGKAVAPCGEKKLRSESRCDSFISTATMWRIRLIRMARGRASRLAERASERPTVGRFHEINMQMATRNRESCVTTEWASA